MPQRFIASVKWGIRGIPRWLGPKCFAPDVAPTSPQTILVLGVCLHYKKNYFEHLKWELGSSARHRVRQKWIVIDPAGAEAVAQSGEIYEKRIARGQPRTMLLNSLLDGERLSDYEYVVVVDDDIKLPRGFVDAYMSTSSALGFSLSQPARTANSYISHPITKQVAALFGRQTHFVEVGPCVWIASALFDDLLPFDEASPMGLGLDLVWPLIVQSRGLTMGIIDSVPVDHSLRSTGAAYDFQRALDRMSEYLSTRRHADDSSVRTVVREFPATK